MISEHTKPDNLTVAIRPQEAVSLPRNSSHKHLLLKPQIVAFTFIFHFGQSKTFHLLLIFMLNCGPMSIGPHPYLSSLLNAQMRLIPSHLTLEESEKENTQISQNVHLCLYVFYFIYSILSFCYSIL